MTPNHVVFTFDGKETTLREFDEMVERLTPDLRSFEGEVIGIWGKNSPDYLVNLFAAMKVRATPLLLQDHLPLSTVNSLLTKAHAKVLITSDTTIEAAVPVLPLDGSALARSDNDSTNKVRHPEIGHSGPNPSLILHTSGTTKEPRLVPFDRANLAHSVGFQLRRWNGTWLPQDGTLGYLPLAHAFGLMSEFFCAYCLGATYHFAPPSPTGLLETLRKDKLGQIRMLFSVPSMLRSLIEQPDGLEVLSKLKFVILGGATPDEDVATKLLDVGVAIVTNYGMTETGCLFQSFPGKDWRVLHPLISKKFFHMNDETNELVIHNDCPTLSPRLDTREYRTGDILRQFQGGYRHGGRLDDVIVHSNGEKTHAVRVENALVAGLGQRISRVALFGNGRPRVTAIFELPNEPTESDRMAVAAVVRGVNTTLPRHSRILSRMVLLVGPTGKRLPLTGKGTVKRREAEQEFRQELDRLYAAPMTNAPSRSFEEILNNEGVLEEVFGDPDLVLDPDVSLQDQGLDSLGAVELTFLLEEAYPDREIPNDIVYGFPTIRTLKKFLEGKAAPPDCLLPTFTTFTREESKASLPFTTKHVVLTGATGFVGTQLVKALLESENIESVHCLVRNDPRWKPHPKVTVSTRYSFDDPYLGLSPRAYAELQKKPNTTVIHVAWPVNFREPFGSLQDSTSRSLENLIKFSSGGGHQLVFISSLATTLLHPTKLCVDEQYPALTGETALDNGYAQTKWLGEHLTLRSGLDHKKVIRLGQISAHRLTGVWNVKEHIPVILKASQKLGVTPILPLPVDWVPVDIAARSIVELLETQGNVHHIANPKPRPASCLGLGGPTLPLREWLAKAKDLRDQLPLLKALWPFLVDMAALGDRLRPLDAQATARLSPTLAACEAISDDYIRKIHSELTQL